MPSRAPVTLPESRRSTRWLTAGLVLALFAVAMLAVLFYGNQQRILSTTSVQLLEQVEMRAGGADKAPDLERTVSPATVWLAAKLVGDSGDAGPALRSVDALSMGILAASIALFAGLVGGPLAGLLAPLFFLLQPQVFQRLMEVGSATALAALLVPTLLMGLGLTRGVAWQRLALLAAAGVAGGLSVFVHHLGLWTTMGGTLAIFLATRPRLERGLLRLAPLGLELAAILLAFLVALGLFYKLNGMAGKGVVEYLFSPFKSFHPAFAVAGDVYRESQDGGPPLWTTCYLWLVRTPLSLWLVAALGSTLAFGAIGRATFSGLRAPALLFLPVGALSAVLIVATGAGSPQYSGTLNLLAPLALWPALLAAAACSSRRREVAGWVRFAPHAVALLVLAHLVLSDARHLPHPSSYANVLTGGSAGALSGRNSLYAEPTIDEAAARELLSLGKKVAVAPHEDLAAPVLRRFARELGQPGLSIRDGGALPMLVLGGMAAPEAPLFLDYCNGPQVTASLTLEEQVLWCVIEPGVSP